MRLDSNTSMLKILGFSREPDPILPEDRLDSPASQLLRGRAVFQAQAGAPKNADALAYCPVQRLLAVSIQQHRVPGAAAHT